MSLHVSGHAAADVTSIVRATGYATGFGWLKLRILVLNGPVFHLTRPAAP